VKPLTEQQWCAKAHRHLQWEAAWHARIAALEERIESVDDRLLVQDILDRAAGLEKRIKRLKQIMARHLERLPGRFLCLDADDTHCVGAKERNNFAEVPKLPNW